MTGLLVCLTTAALGVDYGWQPIAGGGIEYVIQIEPQMLDALKQGDDISSALPAGANNIRRYRIVVGNAALPHHGEPLPVDREAEPPAKESAPAAANQANFEEDAETEGSAALSMPLESPYPPDYEQAGIPLPGPVLNPPQLAQPALTKPSLPIDVETPEVDDVAQAPKEPDVSESHQAAKPPVDSPPEKGAGQRPAKKYLNAGPRLSASGAPVAESMANKREKSNPPVKATKPAAGVAEKQGSASDAEPLSPSDRTAPKSEDVASAANSTTLVGLFASLGGNVFLLWVASGQRSRYRTLLRRSREALAAANIDKLPAPAQEDDGPRWETVGEEEYERETD